MAEVDHFVYGPVIPVLAFLLSALGALLGLVCTVRARNAPTTSRRVWFLGLAAWAIGGTGIWVMHFIAMLGFSVEGTPIRYDVPITAASALIAVTVVAVGLFMVGMGRAGPVRLISGGVITGLGVASMHYTGMAALRLDGTIHYDYALVGASVAIAVAAATAALWFAVTVRRPWAVVGSALLMGLAVSGMHYTGMAAMRVHVHGTGTGLEGSTMFALLLPIILLVVLAVVGMVYAVLAVPTTADDDGMAYLHDREAHRVASLTPDAEPIGGFTPTTRRQSIPRANRPPH